MTSYQHESPIDRAHTASTCISAIADLLSGNKDMSSVNGDHLCILLRHHQEALEESLNAMLCDEQGNCYAVQNSLTSCPA